MVTVDGIVNTPEAEGAETNLVLVKSYKTLSSTQKAVLSLATSMFESFGQFMKMP